jgi:hypothetical protein
VRIADTVGVSIVFMVVVVIPMLVFVRVPNPVEMLVEMQMWPNRFPCRIATNAHDGPFAV